MLLRIIGTYRDAFRGLSREVWILSCVALVNRAGTMVLPFLTLYLRQDLGFSTGQAGLMLAFYGVGAIGGTALGGKLTDRCGYRFVMLSSLCGSGAILLVLGQIDSLVVMGAALVLFAVVAESFRPAGNTALTAFTPAHLRARAFGLYRLAVNAGFTVGPAAGGFLAAVGYGWLFVVDGGTCILAAAVLAKLFPSRRARDAKTSPGVASSRSPWRDPIFVAGGLMLFCQGLIFFQIQSTFALYLKEQMGHSESVIGIVLGVNTALIVAFEMVLLQRIQGRNPLRIIAIASLLIGTGFGLTAHVTGVPALLGAVALWTLGEMLSMPTMMAWAANRADDASRGRTMGAIGVCFSTAFAAAPLIGTQLYERLGPDSVWHATSILGVLLCVGFWILAAIEQRRAEVSSPGDPKVSA